MPLERQQLFGIDLQLGDRLSGLDLVPDATADLDLAKGNENAIQALTLRLKVRQGELAPLGWANYGSRLHELIGEPNVTRTHLKLMAYARAALEPDPRVVEIQDMRTEVLPGDRDTVRLAIDLLLVDNPAPVTLIYAFNLQSA